MRTKAITAMLAAASTAHSSLLRRGSSPSKQLCQGTSHEENGNWYCRQVQRITYENIGASGQYNEVVSMDQQTGDCEFAVRNVSGPLAPFNEPLSLHFRGPLNLKQVAVYMLDSSTSGHKQQQEKRGDPGGVYVSWPNSSAIGMMTMTMTTTTTRVVMTTSMTTVYIPAPEPDPVSVSVTVTGSERTNTTARLPTGPGIVAQSSVRPCGQQSLPSSGAGSVPVSMSTGSNEANTTVKMPTGPGVVVPSSVRPCSKQSSALDGTQNGAAMTSTPSMTTSVLRFSSVLSTLMSGIGVPSSIKPCGAKNSSSSVVPPRPATRPIPVTTTIPLSSGSAAGALPSSSSSPRMMTLLSLATIPASSSTTLQSMGSGGSIRADTLLTTASVTALTSPSRPYSIVPISTGPGSDLSGDASTGTSTPAQFVRTGYYNAAQQKAEGVVFLGNYGGQGSGKWTPKFGNTLSYLKADGTGGASEPTLLKDTTISSSHEVALLTNETCDASCGYVQPGSVAYKGFPGPSRIFLLELSMPHFITTTTPFPSNQADAPAIWLLNARIPYTGQYSCNCWASGCGEIDVLEVLAAGGDKAVSTVHHGSGNRADSDPNYFARPVDVDQPVRVAVVFDAVQGEVSVQVLGQGRGEFPGVLPWMAGRGGEGGLRKLVGDGGDEAEGEGSVFTIGG